MSVRNPVVINVKYDYYAAEDQALFIGLFIKFIC